MPASFRPAQAAPNRTSTYSAAPAAANAKPNFPCRLARSRLRLYSIHMVNERRKYIRLPFQAKGTIRNSSGMFPFVLADISLKGALIQIRKNAPLMQYGESFSFFLSLPDFEADVEATAEVMHHRDGEVGLEFTLIDIDSISILQQLLEQNSIPPEKLEQEVRELTQSDDGSTS